MHQAIIYINPVGVAPIGFAQASGMPGDIKVDFKTQGNLAYPGIVDMHPQLVLRPFTRPGAHAYDIEINDPVGASGIATVPGAVMNDRFTIEVYSRNALLQPQRMLASGYADLHGYAYSVGGPMGPMVFPAGPVGPPGPAGAAGPPGVAGVRGSRWYTGSGAPTLGAEGRVDGDMWLNEDNGDVYRWDAATSMWVGYVRA